LATVTERVARPHPRPTAAIVATITNEAGMPMAESAVAIAKETTATIVAGGNGMSVISFPRESSVRRAIVNAPRATAAQPRKMSGIIDRPTPNSGATAFAMFDAPEENVVDR
jgi:predicted lipoprotein with Yx(FWY)xxD motif